MDVLVSAPLGSQTRFILLRRILGIGYNRLGVLSAVNLFWDQIGQNEGATIRHQEVTHISNQIHSINTSC